MHIIVIESASSQCNAVPVLSAIEQTGQTND